MQNNNKKNQKDLERIEQIAELMDSKFKIPGTNFTFGLDPLLGLIPVVGDMASMSISALTVLAAARSGAGTLILLKMIGNFVVDALVGAIPFLGDIFDFVFKANRRNVRLLRQYYQEDRHTGSATPVLAVVMLVLISVLCLIAFLLYHVLVWINAAFMAL